MGKRGFWDGCTTGLTRVLNTAQQTWLKRDQFTLRLPLSRHPLLTDAQPLRHSHVDTHVHSHGIPVEVLMLNKSCLQGRLLPRPSMDER